MSLENIRRQINERYVDIWPSDHPLLLSNDLKYASWNILVQQTGLVAKNIGGLDYHETNYAFQIRLNLIIDIISLLDKNNLDVIALQEVETETVLRIASSEIYTRYEMLFISDPGKPRGHLILHRNIVIEKIAKRSKLIKKNTKDSKLVGQLFSYNKSEIIKPEI